MRQEARLKPGRKAADSKAQAGDREALSELLMANQRSATPSRCGWPAAPRTRRTSARTPSCGPSATSGPIAGRGLPLVAPQPGGACSCHRTDSDKAGAGARRACMERETVMESPPARSRRRAASGGSSEALGRLEKRYRAAHAVCTTSRASATTRWPQRSRCRGHGGHNIRRGGLESSRG